MILGPTKLPPYDRDLHFNGSGPDLAVSKKYLGDKMASLIVAFSPFSTNNNQLRKKIKISKKYLQLKDVSVDLFSNI
jgi:hypothetical protein